MKVKVRYEDIRVMEAIVEADKMKDVDEEFINCLPNDKFLKGPEEIDGHLSLAARTEAEETTVCVCPECKSENVSRSVFANMNTNEVVTAGLPNEERFCDDCEKAISHFEEKIIYA